MNIVEKIKEECGIVKHDYFYAFVLTIIFSHLMIDPKQNFINYILVFFITLFFIWKSDVSILKTPLHFVLFLCIVLGSQHIPYIG